MMFAKYFEYYTIILRGPFFCGHTLLCEQLELGDEIKAAAEYPLQSQ